MSFVTRSGMPALSQATREKVEAEYQQFYDGIKHLAGLKDFENLYIPTYEEFRRSDIINTAHPLQDQIEQNAMQVEADEDHLLKVKAKYNSNVISQDEYEYETALLKLREMKREGIFNITKGFKARLAQQEKEVEILKQFISSNIIITEENGVVEGSEEPSA